MGIRRLKALLILLALMNLGPGSQCKGSKLLVIHNILLQHNNKRRTLGVDTVDTDLTAHQLHQLLNNA